MLLGSRNINLERMKVGFALYFNRYAADVPEIERFQFEAAGTKARELKRGLWQQQQAILPSVIGSSSRQFRSGDFSGSSRRFRPDVDHSVRGKQRQRGESRRRVRHEHPAPGLPFLASVFAVKVERMGAPRRPLVLADLNVALIGLEPLQALA